MKAKRRNNKIKRNRSEMRKLKPKNFNLYFLISSSFFLSSCFLFQTPSPTLVEEKSQSCSIGNARFIANQITTPSGQEPVTILPNKEGLPDIFILNLKTCFKDSLRTDTPIPESPFEILYESNLTEKEERLIRSSDADGCITWQEKYKYKYTSRSTWVGLKRIIRNQASYTGAVEIETAVNPWLTESEKNNGFSSILDMRCEYDNRTVFESSEEGDQVIQYHQDGLKFLENADQKKPILWAPTISVQIQEDITKGKTSQKRYNLTQFEIKKLLLEHRKPCHRPQINGSLNENCYKRNFNFSFHIPLEFKMLGANGSFDTKLNGGVYNLESILMISPQETDRTYKLSTCINKNEKLKKAIGELNFECIFDIPFFDQNSIFQVLHKISPANPDKPNEKNYLPIKDFQGIYTFEFETGAKRNDFTIDTEYSEIYSEALEDENRKINLISEIDAAEIVSAKQTKEEKEEAESVDLKDLHLLTTGDFKYSNIQPGENTIEREVSFVGKICLTDALNSQKLQTAKFRVFLQEPRKRACEQQDELINQSSDIINGQIKEIFSDSGKFEANDKCLTIPIKIPHKIFDKQRYFQVIAHILSEDLNLYGSVELALNPWQRAFQAFQDAQNLDEKHIRYEVYDIDPPELVINQFRSINLFPSYGLDKLLNIHIFHRFYLLFQPFISRPDNVSLGLDYKSRELLRDGLYLVRVLILRNPKETGHEQAVSSQENLNKDRFQLQVGEEIDLNKLDYITHTDSVVRTKANFVNFFMPLYLSTKQMYYIASRNIIVIQIYPADPEHIVYKDEKKKVVDSTKTKWKPFTDHDLINKPYGGAINIQNWTNWNLLQPVINIDTDTAIESSLIGRKYKHFDFSKLGEQRSQKETDVENCKNNSDENQTVDVEKDSKKVYEVISISEECIQTLHLLNKEISSLYSEIKLVEQESSSLSDLEIKIKTLETEIVKILETEIDNSENSKDQIEKIKNACEESHIEESHIQDPHLESLKKEVESKYTPELLNYFSLENALKPVVLGAESAEGFTESLKESYIKYLDWKKNRRFNFSINVLDYPFFAEQLYSFHSHFYKWRSLNFPNLIESYLIMLVEYSKYSDFSTALFRFVEDNKEMLNSEELGLPESCRRGESSCSEDKLKLIINSNLFENLGFANGEDAFIKKQALLFMMLFPFSEKIPFNSLNMDSYNTFKQLLKDHESIFIDRLNRVWNPMSIQMKAEKELDQFIRYKHNHLNDLIYKNIDPEKSFNQETLKVLVNEGIKSENINTFKNVAFLKSLCLFWFEDFMKNYFDPELRISTYTNYVRKFDYLRILEHAYIRNTNDSFFNDLQSASDQIESKEAMGGKERECHIEYRECVSKDFCFASPIGDTKGDVRGDFCKNISSDSDDSSCSDWRNQICSDPNNGHLSLCGDQTDSKTCYKDVNYFCRLNPDKGFCDDFENRCFKKYTVCLESNCLESNCLESNCLESNCLFQRDLDQILNNPDEAIETCVKDFNEFFKIENKMFVYDISPEDNDLQYRGGFLRGFSVSKNNSIGSYMNWTSQRGKSISLSLDPTKILPSLFTFGLSGSMSQSQSDNESNSGRVAWDIRAGDGVYLSVGQAEIEIGVKEFQKCLVIKPRPNSFIASYQSGTPKDYTNLWSEEATDFDKIVFSRPGLILCNPVEKSSQDNLKKIKEYYYYISQANTEPSNSQFLDLYDLANRPFIAVLRGKREFMKFYHVARRTVDQPINENPGNMFTFHRDVVEDTRGLILKLREVTQTGFYPGVYDYPFDVHEEIDASYLDTNSSTNGIVHQIHPLSLFNVPDIPSGTTPFN